MSRTTDSSRTGKSLAAGAMALMMGVGEASYAVDQETHAMSTSATTRAETQTLSARQQAILPIAAFAAVGNISSLNGALREGLDAGLTISDAREILVQLYAYAGFPRSLNALGELMKVVESRRQSGIEDAPGREPGKPIPKGDDLLAAGTANQTKLSGAPVQGPLFDFAPVANEYLRSHLFGDIFERDNLDWQSRELATLSMLAALDGVAPQLQAHMRISLNVGLSTGQLRQVSQVLAVKVNEAAGARAVQALEAVSPVSGGAGG